MLKWIFLIPFPSARIAPGCQRGHYAKPSPEVQRAHGGLISQAPPLRAAPCRSDCARRCGRFRFPPGGPVFCSPEGGRGVRSPLCLPLPALLFLSRRSHHRRHRLCLQSRGGATCYIHPPQPENLKCFRKIRRHLEEEHPPTPGLFSASIDSSFLFSDLLTQPDLRPHRRFSWSGESQRAAPASPRTPDAAPEEHS